uniref:nucleoside triphosphate pyrophosphohydrolase n=2 Tax=Candidatus Limnocylindrus sp. TaxID=2802978 RepID=UPI004049B38B
MTSASGDSSLNTLLASARVVAPLVDLSHGVALIPEEGLAGAAFDLRLPLIVTRGGTLTALLPGRAGKGIALLIRLYGAPHAVTLLPSGTARTLGECAEESADWEAILVPPLAPLDALASPWAMPWLSARLRAPDGCPWDREQTHLTLAKHLIEESWELHDAIEAHAANPGEKADAAMAEELGDVLLQVILHTQLASERGAFDLTDVQERLARKIIRRHPHVFGEGTAETSREVQRTWEAIKAEERAERAQGEAGVAATAGETTPAFKSALAGVSRGLPALSASRELQDRASALGYDWPTLDGVLEKLDEELGELSEALTAAGNPDSITGRPASGAAALAAAQDELGDVIAVLVNLGRRSGIDAEAALRGANDKFRRRFSEVERRAAARGVALKSADFATLDALWDEAKAVERSQS